MKRIATLIVLIAACAFGVIGTLRAQPSARRGGPGTQADPRGQYYVVDSDDNYPLAPTYAWADTSGGGTWTRITGWTNTDDGYSYVPKSADSVQFTFYNSTLWLLPPPYPLPTPPGGNSQGSSISTNGTISLVGTYTSPFNVPMMQATGTYFLAAPLWGDWEFRTGGDSTKVYVCRNKDTFYVSYYNLGLKGTNGQVLATFQTKFTKFDSCMTVRYRSFDGSFRGESAAAIIQRNCTIGVQDFPNPGGYGTTYMHKGLFYARNNSSIYNKDLHNGLAVKFFRQTRDAFAITAITQPPNDRYEMPTNIVTPAATIYNMADTAIKIFCKSIITNLGTGNSIYNRTDSIIVAGTQSGTLTGNSYAGLPCGSYKLTMTLSYANNVPDEWAGDNTLTRTFVYLGTQTYPFHEEFAGNLSYCTWSSCGANVLDAQTNFINPAPPVNATSNGLLFDRLDDNGNVYSGDATGDTITSGPINLSGKIGAYLSFNYQRGLRSDTSIAGSQSRLLFGPDLAIADVINGGFVQSGDTLVVEGLASSAPTWNPTTGWGTLGIITGGLDTALNTFRVALPSSYQHDHFRLRLRYKAHNSQQPAGLPMDDYDAILVDAIQIINPTDGQTELAPIDVDLGNGPYTHVPRDLTAGLTPKVRVMNNGKTSQLGLNIAHLIVKDQLGRAVYDRSTVFGAPSAFTDSLVAMPAWDIHGSQGGIFTAKVLLEQLVYDLYHTNDSNIFYKTMNIDDSYALDDGVADTVGTTVTAPNEFFYDFSPLSNDTLKGLAFYYQATPGTRNWQCQIKQDTHVVATRTISVSVSGRGWFRSTFAGVKLFGGQTYRIHLTQSTGTDFGGDASRSLVYLTSANGASSTYRSLYPGIMQRFLNLGQVNYDVQPPNADAGGPLLPMFRLIYSGASQYLPVDLVSFTAERGTGANVTLGWRTAREEDVARYEIERQSQDGNAWEAISSSGAKNASGASYGAIDANAPLTEASYRLMEHDLDGSIHEIGQAQIAAMDAAVRSVTLYPNPASTKMVVAGMPIGATLTVRDALGREMAVPHSVTGTSGDLDLSTLANGAYHLEVSANGSTTTHPFTVLK